MKSALYILTVLLLFSPSYFEKQTERQIKNYLIKELKISEAKVNLKFNNVFSAYSGKVSALNIKGKNLSLEGLNSADFEVQIKNVKYSFLKAILTQKIKVKKIKKIEEKFIVSENDLNNFILLKLKHLKNFYLKILEGKAKVSGKVDLKILNPDFKFEVKIKIKNKKELWMDIDKAKISIIPIPDFLIDFIFGEVNPIFVLPDNAGREFLDYLSSITSKKYKNVIENINLKNGYLEILTSTVPY